MDLEMVESAETVAGTAIRERATVTYDINGGEGRVPAPQSFLTGQVIRLATISHSRELFRLDHIFDGWWDPVTDRLYKQGESARFNQNVVLYAKFSV